MEVTDCGIHGFHEVIGIDTDDLGFHWSLVSDDGGIRQVAYRVIVWVASSDASAASGVCWDSGRVQSDAQRNVVCYPSAPFQSTTFHYWQVTVWDQHATQYQSSVNEFYTSYPRCSGLLPPYSMNQTYMPHSSQIFQTWFEDEANRWKAVWLGDGGDKPLYLRKPIQIAQQPQRVVILASGLGHFNLTLNGKPASKHVLDPGWTNYHRTVQFVGYDVTALWQAGENVVVGAHVGNGFYAGDQGDRFFWPTYEDNTYVRYGNELCFFAEVHLHYPDGSHDTIITDPSWKVRKSATGLANIYVSEDFYRRQYPVGRDSPGYDESGDSWAPAKPLTGPRGKLRYQSQPPVVLHNSFQPVRNQESRPGITVFDLGQNSSIMVHLELSGPSGSEVIVRYSEEVGPEGEVYMADPLFKEFEYGVYSKITLGGDRESWTPDFSFTSARYIQVEGASLDADDYNYATIHAVSARHVSSAARNLGYLITDKEDVNTLIRACYWTFSSNIFSYHTYCPQIEKFGWLEVTSLLAPATQYVRDMEAVYTKILGDIIDTQESNGLVPTMAPEIRYMCGPLHDTITWGCAICFLPQLLKQYYGSTRVFKRIYEPGARYMDYMRTKERHGGLIEHGLGDWGYDIAYGNHQANIETAVYYRCLQNMALMARDLGLFEDAVRYEAWAARIFEVYNRHLLVTDRQSYPYAFYTSRDQPDSHDRTMVGQAMALQFELVPAAHRDDVIRAFVAAVEESGPRIRAGEIGLKYVWSTFADPGVDRPDLVLAMARQEEHPSYMRFLRRGDTTLSEFWQDACRSKCHDMLGTIYEWFYAAVLGIQPVEDAYRTWTLHPPIRSEFNFVEGQVDCPYGPISVLFDRRYAVNGTSSVSVRVPMSTTCKLLLPDGYLAVIREDKSISSQTITTGGTLRPGLYIVEISK
ncbi:hypothetical protein N8T08_002522 [Aspergillus melleus]|uniref:Uncharacterized protein n=1 Tax=Aspergillus melleus TaxID=138277 RepID=A0ACC3B8U0_9EURO|nr:hypothetical protein N8T08_002522 [Aspergillus melleus]